MEINDRTEEYEKRWIRYLHGMLRILLHFIVNSRDSVHVINALLITNKNLHIMRFQTVNSQKVYNTAKACLGTSLSGNIPDLGCARSINNLWIKTFGHPIGGGDSTQAMYPFLQDKTKFYMVEVPLPGDVIISPTGHGNGSDAHGHVGVMAYEGILSNNSENGLFQEKWTLSPWIAHYAKQGGFIVEFYRVL